MADSVPPEAYEAAARDLAEHRFTAYAYGYGRHGVECTCGEKRDHTNPIMEDEHGAWGEAVDAFTYAHQASVAVDAAWPFLRSLAVAEGRKQATAEVDLSWSRAVELAAPDEDFSAKVTFAAGVAEGRRQAAAEIRAEDAQLHASAIMEWAARIAEGNTDAVAMATPAKEIQA